MRREKTLLLIGYPTEAVLAAKSLGLDVILFQHKSKLAPDQARYSDAMFLVDYTDTDAALALSGRINDLYGLGGTGFEVSHLLHDKWAMRQRLAGSGVPTVGAMLVNGRESLWSFADAYGYPFIVKPADLSGGFGVRRVDGPGEIDAAWDRLLNWQESGMEKGPSSLLPVGDFIMEEYADGPEYSVEAFSFAGRHVVIAVTEKLADERYFAELGRYGPVVIESHNRAGGGRIRDLVQAGYGIDLTRYIVGWPFGLVDELLDNVVGVDVAGEYAVAGYGESR